MSNRLKPLAPLLGKPFFWKCRGFVTALEPGADSLSNPGVKLLAAGAMADANKGKAQRLVAELTNGKIIGEATFAATEDDQVLTGVQMLYGVVNPAAHWSTKRRRMRFAKRFPGTALLVVVNADNYYHWLLDSLPRLRLLAAAGWTADKADWVLVGASPFPFHQQTLDLLGVPVAKRLACSKWTVQQFDRLIVPSLPSSECGRSPAWVSEFLRSSFLPLGAPASSPTSSALAQGLACEDAGAPGRIYVSRRRSRNRRLLNELELETALQGAGFQIVLTEKLSFLEQVRTFACARVIVAPHGAGLANLVFCQSGAQVVELFHPDRIQHVNYRVIAQHGGLNYHALVGTSTSVSPCPDDERAEFTISIENVLRRLP